MQYKKYQSLNKHIAAYLSIMEPYDALQLFNSIIIDSIKGTEEKEYLAFTKMYSEIAKVEDES